MGKKLTPVEQEFMSILWARNESGAEGGTVRDVLEGLPEERQLAYTSVSTILRILQDKKILTAKKIGRQHIYIPCLSREEFENQSVDSLVDDIFHGKAAELVAFLLDKNKLSMDEITQIETMIHDKAE